MWRKVTWVMLVIVLLFNRDLYFVQSIINLKRSLTQRWRKTWLNDEEKLDSPSGNRTQIYRDLYGSWLPGWQAVILTIILTGIAADEDLKISINKTYFFIAEFFHYTFIVETDQICLVFVTYQKTATSNSSITQHYIFQSEVVTWFIVPQSLTLTTIM